MISEVLVFLEFWILFLSFLLYCSERNIFKKYYAKVVRKIVSKLLCKIVRCDFFRANLRLSLFLIANPWDLTRVFIFLDSFMINPNMFTFWFRLADESGCNLRMNLFFLFEYLVVFETKSIGNAYLEYDVSFVH